MGKKSTPSAPAAPDPNAVASAQGAANLQSGIANSYLNNANERGPLGSVNYDVTGYESISETGPLGQTITRQVPRFTRTTTMSPEQRGLYDQQVQIGSKMNNAAMGQIDRINGTLSSPLTDSDINFGPDSIRGATPTLQRANDWSGAIQSTFGDAGEIQRDLNATDYSADRKRVEDSLYARLNPELDRSRSALENSLVNQGMVRGSQAFNEAMDEARRAENDARMGVVRAGGEEQSRLVGLDLSRKTFQNAAQEQTYGQQLGRAGFYNSAIQQKAALEQGTKGFNNSVAQAEFGNAKTNAEWEATAGDRKFQRRTAMRNQPINEISALMSGGQVSMPTFAQYRGGNVDPSPIAQATYNSAQLAQDAWKTESNNSATTRAGLYNLAGSVLGAGITKWSDERLKQNVTRVGTLDGRIPTYTWSYTWEPEVEHYGVIAQDLEELAPHAIVHTDSGLMAVNYGAL